MLGRMGRNTHTSFNLQFAIEDTGVDGNKTELSSRHAKHKLWQKRVFSFSRSKLIHMQQFECMDDLIEVILKCLETTLVAI